MAQKNTKNKTNIAAYNQLTGRMNLAGLLGRQYGGKRNIYKALGYPEDNITYDEYFAKYMRMDMAGAIINRPIEATWRGNVVIYDPLEYTDGIDTLKKAWIDLDWELRLKEKFIRVDKLSSLGRYGILLLGFNDVKNAQSDFQTEVQKTSGLKLVYVTPHGEDTAKIKTFVTDTTNPRYGLPLLYEVNTVNDSGQSFSINVHHSRVIHITGETLTSETYGIPTLQRVYNRLMDLEKLIGGSAEMFWRGARPGYAGKVDKDYSSDDTTDQELNKQFDEYENNLRRLLINEGVEITALQTQISDPTASVDVQITMISCITGIPKRILLGSERAELASSQDTDAWYSKIDERREEYAEPQILGQFVSRLQKLGILPDKRDYGIEWKSLHLTNDKDKAEVGRIRASALKEYSSTPGIQEIMPPALFYKHFLGFTDEQITEIEQIQEQMLLDMPEEQDPSVTETEEQKNKDKENITE